MQQQQQQICESQIGWPSIHPSLAYQNQGIMATQEIAASTILLQIEYRKCISEETLPQIFKNIQAIQQTDKITIYLLVLQNLKQPYSNNHNIVNWLKSDTAGFIRFSEQLMRQMNDEQLLIQYMAYKKYYHEQSHKLYTNKQIRHLLYKFTNVTNQIQFKQQYIKASQFRNTRSFGYTKQTLIIPGFDYMNYDPSKDCTKLKFVTFNNQQQLQTLSLSLQMQQMNVEHQGINTNNNNDNSESDEEMQDLNLPSASKFISIIAMKQIKKGEQLNFDYGGLSNSHLIKTYGYAVPNNPKDYLKLYISKYTKQRMIYFSEVERCTIKYKIRFGILNLKLIQDWLKLYEKQGKNQKQTLHLLIQHLQCTPYPIPMLKNDVNQNRQVGFQYMKIYKYQQQTIYQGQIKLISEFSGKLHTKEKLNN